MERLTWRVNGEARMKFSGIEVCGPDAERFAAYEGTGLEPEAPSDSGSDWWGSLWGGDSSSSSGSSSSTETGESASSSEGSGLADWWSSLLG